MQTVPVDWGIFKGWLFVLFMVIISYGGFYGLNYCGAVVNYTVIK